MKRIAIRTRILMLLLVMVALMQFFPGRAALIELVTLTAGGLYFLAWGAVRYKARYEKQAQEAAQAAADDREYRQYQGELDAIRARYEPRRDWSDPTSISHEYQAELTALHDKHQDMLTRKFGPR